MSSKRDFRDYAERVDALAKQTREQVQKAEAEVKAAEEARARYPRNGGKSPEYLAKAARAESEFQAALAKRDDLNRVLANNVEREITSIRAELETAVDDAFAARPEALDTAALTLLQSGILRPGEFMRLFNGAVADRNWTMARMVGLYADKAAEAAAGKYGITDRLAVGYREIGNAARRVGGEPYFRNFDVLADVLKRRMKNPALWSQWEALTGEIIEKGFI